MQHSLDLFARDKTSAGTPKNLITEAKLLYDLSSLSKGNRHAYNFKMEFSILAKHFREASNGPRTLPNNKKQIWTGLDLVKIIMCTLVFRDFVPLSEYIKYQMYPGNQVHMTKLT